MAKGANKHILKWKKNLIGKERYILKVRKNLIFPQFVLPAAFGSSSLSFLQVLLSPAMVTHDMLREWVLGAMLESL